MLALLVWLFAEKLGEVVQSLVVSVKVVSLFKKKKEKQEQSLVVKQLNLLAYMIATWKQSAFLYTLYYP